MANTYRGTIMTLCCLSDTHNKHEELDLSKYPADVLIHAGDFSSGTKNSTLAFLDWMEIQPYKHKILIAGNHDWIPQNDPKWFKKALEYAPSVTYLQDTETVIDGVKFYGSPYSNEFCGWAFMKYDDDLEYIWAEIPSDVDVLITHGPAYKCHDKVIGPTYGRDPYVGSQSLANRKLELDGTLKVHVSGHIHEAYGQSIERNWTNVCACVLNEKYQLVNKPIILEI